MWLTTVQEVELQLAEAASQAAVLQPMDATAPGLLEVKTQECVRLPLLVVQAPATYGGSRC